MAGFIFESNRNTRHSFTAETCLSPEVAAGWGTKRKLQTKVEVLKQKVSVHPSFDSISRLCALLFEMHDRGYTVKYNIC